jgi:hypothetical protein
MRVLWYAAAANVRMRGPFATAVEAWKFLELKPEDQARAGHMHMVGAYVWPVDAKQELETELRPGVWHAYVDGMRTKVKRNTQVLASYKGKYKVLYCDSGVWHDAGGAVFNAPDAIMLIVPPKELAE